MKVRVTFEKKGVMRYISHLDLQRAFIRALLRSGLDITYSEGFNPHPRLAFAVPLGMFQESICEVCDFGINDDTPLDVVKDRLSAALPEGLKVLKCEVPLQKISKVKSASYRVVLHTDQTIPQLEEKLRGPLTAIKKGKNGDREVDVSAGIYNSRLCEENGQKVLYTTVSSAPDAILNPSLIASALGCDDCDVLRTEIHFEN